MAPIVEVYPDGDWVDLTAKVRLESGVDMFRGRKAESDLSNSQLTFVLDNRDNRFSSDVPGTPYYRTLGRGTPIRVRESIVRDSFTRSASNGWGTCELPAMSYTTAGGSASDYSVTGGVGRHTLTTVAASRLTYLQLRLRDVMIKATVTVGALATGASSVAALTTRRTPNGMAHYRFELRFTTSGAVTAAIARLGGPFHTDLDTATLSSTYTDGSTFHILGFSVGNAHYMKAWPLGEDEPEDWTCEATDGHLRAGHVGCRTNRETGNTNSNLTMDFDSFEVSDPRFFGEVWSLRPMADQSGNDRTVTVEAAGLFRRLSNTRKTVRSSLYRTLSTGSGVTTPTTAPVAYWPLEDGSNATQLEALGASGRTGTVGGAEVSLAADSDLPGSQALPSCGAGGFLSGQIVSPDIDGTTDEWAVTWVGRIDELPEDESVIARIPCSGADVAGYEVAINSAGQLIVRGLKSHNLLLDIYTFEEEGDFDTEGEDSLLGQWVIFTLYTTITGGPTYDIALRWGSATQDQTVSEIGPTSGATVHYEPRGIWTLYGPQESGSRGFGHFAVWSGNVSLTYEQTIGWAGEEAHDRIERLCTEENIAYSLRGSTSEIMGPQIIGSLLDNLEDTSTADHGVLCEPRHQLGIAYRTKTTLYNQLPLAEIDIDASQLHGGLEPVRDDSSGLANLVIATRPRGTPQTFVIPDDDPIHLTTQDPPTGIGLVEGTVDPNVETDVHAAAQAAWAAHIKSWREPRYEEITVCLHGPAYTSDPNLTAAVSALDLGDVFSLVNQPEWVPPEPIELMVQGIREYTTAKTSSSGVVTIEREITFNCSPAVAWEVWGVDTSGSTIVTAEDSDEVNFKVATSSGPEWITNPDPPFLIRTVAGGEAMLVTGVTTDTPAFIAAGTVAHGNNASVAPGLPAGMTADAGQLMVCTAAIRNSGTGTVDLPSGWTDIANFGNLRVFGRYYVTGDAAPTVTFTGGAANADTTARIAGFSGLSPHLDYTASTQLNSSAANVAYPALALRAVNNAGRRRVKCVTFIAAWKQDDTSGVTAASGFTEAWEASTTTGDDQSLALDYRIDATATAVTAGSKTWAGGASAISRTIVFALRPLQSVTVERAANGVSGSITAGDAIHVWRHGVVAL